MKIKRHAFTLTELLVSLFILGTIAVFAIPPLMNDIHTKIYLNLVKNMSVTIEQLAVDQMLNRRVRKLSDTDFSSAEKLLTNNHFSIVNSSDTGLLTSTYKSMNNATITTLTDFLNKRSVLLKNGMILSYIPKTQNTTDNTITGTFVMDANGNDGPNVIGKDFFIFDITEKGKIIPNNETLTENTTLLSHCMSGNPRSCYAYVVNNGWKYPQ